MGIYVNPGNEGFAEIRRGRYVDKTGIIALVNEVVGTPDKLVAVTRPRRFGKSFAARAIVAYYCNGCDSRPLFEDLRIGAEESFEEHLNAYNVVQLDMTEFTGTVGADVVPAVREALVEELREEFPDVRERATLEASLLEVAKATGRKFMFVIDEWDAVFREAANDADAQGSYVKLLRSLFKSSNFTPRAIAAAYITGILPIKRYGTQSAMTDFREYTMLAPDRYAPFVGFTEDEVEGLCAEYGMDLGEMRYWYDGYDLPLAGSVYAPYSVMLACQNGRVGTYWTRSETFETLRFHIDLDFDGLQEDVLRLLGGEELRVDTRMFQNDMVSLASRDDALTLLVHLGYLAYDEASKRVRIPNEEVRGEFRSALGASRHDGVARVVRESELLLRSLLDGDAPAFAAGLQRAHDTACAPTFYNDEQALRAVVKAALIATADDYARVDELPSGHGLADVVYLPKRGSGKPALLVELKWDKPVEGAVAQVCDRDYPQVLRDLECPVVVAGVTYDAQTKKHVCEIERF